jgi:hypothetical protein
MTLKYNKVFIINPAKVASASFYHGLKNKYHCFHGHNLDYLKQEINNNSNNLIICGVRNPITRNESYFFQTKKDDYFNDFKTSKNNYEGEYCYIDPNKDLMTSFNNFKYKYTYLEWLDEFINITEIKEYNHQRGFQIYGIKNNNTLLVYTFEKLNQNKKVFEDLLNFKIENRNVNNGLDYLKFRCKVIYKKDYLDRLLFNKTMNFFYSKKDIELFYNNAFLGDK